MDDLNPHVVFLNPQTCGLYKKGNVRYKVDEHGSRSKDVVDNQLLDHVNAYLSGARDIPGVARVPLPSVLKSRVLVPRYYDYRYAEPFHRLKKRLGVASISLGELVHRGDIIMRGGHGSPSNDQRVGSVPYIKVSDIRNLRVNINPTNLIPPQLARSLWGGAESGLRAWDLLTPNRASSNIGEFAILLPGEEDVVVTKEVFVIRTTDAEGVFDPFYLLWSFSLAAVRNQWQRLTLMQTNREDVGERYREIELPMPPDREWARAVSGGFRRYFTTLATARAEFVESVRGTKLEYIASVQRAGLGTEAEAVDEGCVDETSDV